MKTATPATIQDILVTDDADWLVRVPEGEVDCRTADVTPGTRDKSRGRNYFAKAFARPRLYACPRPVWGHVG